MLKPVAIVQIVHTQQRRERMDFDRLLEAILYFDQCRAIRVRLGVLGRRAGGGRLSRQLGHGLQGLVG